MDVETTGYSPDLNEIVEIAIVRFALALPHNDALALNTIVRPRRRVPNWRIHGITNRMVRAAPPFAEIAGNIVDAVADCTVVCHNARFDLSFLRVAFRRLGVEWNVPYLCTLRLKDALGLKGPGSLADQCRFFSIDAPGRPHTALHDAFATAALLRALISYAGVSEVESLAEAFNRETPVDVGDLDIEPSSTGTLPHLVRTEELKPRKVA